MQRAWGAPDKYTVANCGLEFRWGGRSDQVMPGDEQKTPDKSKMLEERVLGHEALRHRKLPEAVGNEGRHQGEARKPKRAQPAVESSEDQRGAHELGDDRGDRDRCGRGDAEMPHLVDRAVQVERL